MTQTFVIVNEDGQIMGRYVSRDAALSALIALRLDRDTGHNYYEIREREGAADEADHPYWLAGAGGGQEPRRREMNQALTTLRQMCATAAGDRLPLEYQDIFAGLVGGNLLHADALRKIIRVERSHESGLYFGRSGGNDDGDDVRGRATERDVAAKLAYELASAWAPRLDYSPSYAFVGTPLAAAAESLNTAAIKEARRHGVEG